jgi:hypothetical protein
MRIANSNDDPCSELRPVTSSLQDHTKQTHSGLAHSSLVPTDVVS